MITAKQWAIYDEWLDLPESEKRRIEQGFAWLDSRTRNTLTAAGFWSINDLESVTDGDFLALDGLGKKGLADIRTCVVYNPTPQVVAGWVGEA